MVAGSFLLLGMLTMTTLPRFFSCTDPPPPQRRSLDAKEKVLDLELEQMNSTPSDKKHTVESNDPANPKLC